MTRRRKQDAPVVISILSANGRMTHTPVRSREGQSLVGEVLERVTLLRENGDEELHSMADVLRNLGVPEEHQRECTAMIEENLNALAGVPRRGGWATIPRDVLREFMPYEYEGSCYEQSILSRRTFFAEGDGLRHLAHMVGLLADSYGKADDDLTPDEVKCMLVNLSRDIRMAANLYEPEDRSEPGNERALEAA